MWRHAVNAYMRVSGKTEDFMIVGPLRGGGELIELGWCLNVASGCTVRFAAAISGSLAPTAGNLRAGTSLIQRSSSTVGHLGVPMVVMAVAATEFPRIVLPMSVRLDAGGQYIVVGVTSPTTEITVDVLVWALEIGPYRRGDGGERAE